MRGKSGCANPHILKLLETWRDEARSKGSKLQHVYAKAIRSLEKYPLPIRSGSETLILEGFGDSIARRLDAALGVQHAAEGLPHTSSSEQGSATTGRMHVPPPQSPARHTSTKETTSKKQKRQPKGREYIPGYRTGAYALIITLHSSSQGPGHSGHMTKAELQREAQPLSETSFTVPDPGCRYTAWSSMSTLIKKGLVLKTGHPPRFSITEQGCVLAAKLQRVAVQEGCSAAGSSEVRFTLGAPAPQPDRSATTITQGAGPGRRPEAYVDFASSPDSSDCEEVAQRSKQARSEPEQRITREDGLPSGSVFKPKFVFTPGMFDIVLCVDMCETAGGSARSSKDNLLPELKNNGVAFDVRKLQVGDFLWVARERTAPIPGRLSVPTPRELVLDYIVERKRMDDLCQSITDGRFREQKFRLRQCGLKHPVYLVERFGSSKHLSLPESTLEQAIVNTQVVDRFFVKRTQDLKESVAYLTVMTRYLEKTYANKTLVGCDLELLSEMKSCDGQQYLLTFDEFNQSAVKNKVMTVRELFGKQLMQVSGVSADKASAVLDQYPTPALLLQAYASQPSEKQRELMLSQLKSGKNQRNLGPALSKLIYQVYSS